MTWTIGWPLKSGATRSRGLRTLVTALVLLVVLCSGMGIERMFAGGTAVGSQRYADLEDVEEFETLVQTYELIREEYVLSGEVTDEELIYGASEGMMTALGDTNHSRFLTPEEAETYYDSLANTEFVGIGIQVDDSTTPPVITAPIADSPAIEAGILPGDQIMAIDGVATSSFASPALAVDEILGEEGTDVTLELLHPGETEPYEVTITRRGIVRHPVAWAMLPDDILWLRVNAFNEGAGQGVAEALAEGERLGARGVILDLRGNPGGLITEEAEVVGQFLPEGAVVFQSQDADGAVEEYLVPDQDGAWREGPLVVLINGDSVSAAEVTAAAIERNGRAITIGETTFGTGTSLAHYDLPDGSLVMMGVNMWLTPDGEVVWHKGLDPLVTVANDPLVPLVLPYQFESGEVTDTELDEAGDNQLLVAFEVVSGLAEDASSDTASPEAALSYP